MAFLDANGPQVAKVAIPVKWFMNHVKWMIQFDVYAKSNSVWSGNMDHCS